MQTEPVPAIWISLNETTWSNLPIEFNRLNPSLPLCWREMRFFLLPSKLSSALRMQTDFLDSRYKGRQELLRAWRQDVIITQVNYLCHEKIGAVNETLVYFTRRSVSKGASPACFSDYSYRAEAAIHALLFFCSLSLYILVSFGLLRLLWVLLVKPQWTVNSKYKRKGGGSEKVDKDNAE